MLKTPGMVLINPKFPHNVGATIRACSCFGVESLMWTGSRINVSAYKRLPREERMKGFKRVRFMNDERPTRTVWAMYSGVRRGVRKQRAPYVV